MNSLDLHLSISLPCFPLFMWYKTHSIQTSCHIFALSLILLNVFTKICLEDNPKVTPTFTRVNQKPLIFGSSANDLIRVNMHQCRERDAMFFSDLERQGLIPVICEGQTLSLISADIIWMGEEDGGWDSGNKDRETDSL